ncbi:cyclodeaminase/cyclohydrolase family protein [Eggerthellaceae bacterium 3-80]|nr:sugar ABC transporter substrate-binding protein [bacterium D16-34]
MDTRFIESLASADPTPGGGGASAYVGVLASSLASMVGNLTLGKKSYAQVEADVYITLEKLAVLRERLLELIDEDARAFEPLAAAYKMPKDTPQDRVAKNDALQAALIGACDVPLEIMQRVADVVEQTSFLAYNGSRMALSDVGVAVAFARAASDGASLNIFINAKSMDDETKANWYRDEAAILAANTRAACDELFAYVKDEIS